MLKRNKRGRFAKGSVPLNKGKKMNSDFRRRCSAGKQKFIKQHPEYAESMSRIRKNYFKNHPAARKKLSVAMKKAMTTSLKKQIDRKVTEFWRNHPGLRKQKSNDVRRYYINHPIALKNLLNYSKKSAKPHLKTKQGFLVRSKGEQAIANYLFSNSIKAEYESKVLKFPEMICIPDFFLPKTKVYIEFYGGYPAAWKRKVEKNKVYRKHKVHCIFITPAELRDLKKAMKE